MRIVFKKNLYNFFAAVFFAAFFLIIGTAKAGTLSCALRTSLCNGGEVEIFEMQKTSNSHAGLPATGYNNLVCCSGVAGLGNSCSGTFAIALKLSGISNAHIRQGTLADYPGAANACISVPFGGSVSVGYQAADCAGYDTILGSMRGTTNSHVGNGAWANGNVKICATAASAPGYQITGYVVSSTFDTGVSGGAAYNSLMWKGILGGGLVRMQFAASECSNGKTNFPDCNDAGNWLFKGQDCNTLTYYEAASDTPIEIMCADHNNKRFFRYKVILCSSSDCSTSGLGNPEVTEVAVNWAR